MVSYIQCNGAPGELPVEACREEREQLMKRADSAAHERPFCSPPMLHACMSGGLWPR